jgi:hypothetical protein
MTFPDHKTIFFPGNKNAPGFFLNNFDQPGRRPDEYFFAACFTINAYTRCFSRRSPGTIVNKSL